MRRAGLSNRRKNEDSSLAISAFWQNSISGDVLNPSSGGSIWSHNNGFQYWFYLFKMVITFEQRNLTKVRRISNWSQEKYTLNISLLIISLHSSWNDPLIQRHATDAGQPKTIQMFRLSKNRSLQIDGQLYWKKVTLFWGRRWNIPTWSSSHVDAAVNPQNVHRHRLQGAIVRDAL